VLKPQFEMNKGGEDHSIPDLDEILAQVHSRYRISFPISPASSTPRIQYFHNLYRNGQVAINGGFGEIARRHFLNRLILFGGWKGSPDNIYNHIKSKRMNLFSKDVLASMMTGVFEDIEAQRDALPTNLNIENAIDLICVRTRLPNIYGYHQGYMDSIGLYITIFAQPSILKLVLELPLSLRRNAAMFRQLIRNRNPKLTRHPLVSETSITPWLLPRKVAILLKRIKSKSGMSYLDPRPDEFLQTVKPFILDLVHSSQISSNPIYDKNRVQSMALQYYKGDHSFANILDWWIAFEIWRGNLQSPDQTPL